VATELIRTGRAAHAVLGADISTSFTGVGAQIAPAGASGARPVTPGGPAAQAGLRPGDVIVRFAGQPIGSATVLLDAVRSQPPGSRVGVTFLRGTVRRTVTLTLGSAQSLPGPAPWSWPKAPAGPARRFNPGPGPPDRASSPAAGRSTLEAADPSGLTASRR
jgi:putative serine protease PepD